MFQANPQSPFYEALRQLAAALALSATPADEGPAKAGGKVPKMRKSERLGLSAPYDWPNPDIQDDALIAKAGASLRFEDVAALCAHYGLDRVRSVLAKSAEGDLERKILARQLKKLRRPLPRRAILPLDARFLPEWSGPSTRCTGSPDHVRWRVNLTCCTCARRCTIGAWGRISVSCTFSIRQARE